MHTNLRDQTEAERKIGWPLLSVVFIHSLDMNICHAPIHAIIAHTVKMMFRI